MDWPYSEDFISEFFDLYETMPSLWDPSSDEYRDHEIRTRDCSLLLEKFREVEPEASKPYLMKKMSMLRRQYRNEKRKSKEQRRPIRKRFERLCFLPDPAPLKRRKPKSRDPLDFDSTSEDSPDVPLKYTEDIKPAQSSQISEFPQEDEQNQIGFDRFDHVARAWTESLKIMPRHQQILAERIINNILFEAQIGNLSTRSPIEVSKLLQTNLQSF